MKQIKVGYIGNKADYQVVQFENGFFGVLDTLRGQCVSFGMRSAQAAGEWAHRLNLRRTHGV